MKKGEVGPGQKVQGMTAPDGAIHLVAGNLSERAILGVLLHEVFHADGKALVGEARW